MATAPLAWALLATSAFLGGPGRPPPAPAQLQSGDTPTLTSEPPPASPDARSSASPSLSRNPRAADPPAVRSDQQSSSSPAANLPPAVSSPPSLGRPRFTSATLRPIRHIATSEPAVAITFDACATRTQENGFDRGVFEILKREQVPATIFVSGRWVESHPDAMTELAREPLIEFGDHSYDHPHMSRLQAAQIAAEIDQTEAALGQYGKRAVAFRPPFGDWNPRLVSVVQDRQLPTVTWDVVSGDPSAKTTTTTMIREVVHRARAGSIIIFHINGRGWKTAEALPTILNGLRERGFRFVPLSQLMGAGSHE
jgi:peptidoglycan/xylan/chitin deacetylase (PgdA/CDA1 family)